MTSTSLSPTGRSAARTARPYVLFAVVMVVLVTGGLLLLVNSGGGDVTTLSTRSAEPDGGRALATLLRDQGVDVDQSTSTSDTARDATSDTTIVVTDTTFLTDEGARKLLATGSDLVLIDPQPTRLDVLAPGVRESPGLLAATAPQPGCSLPAATRAGRAEVGQASGYRLSPGTEATTCYRSKGSAALVQLADGDRTVTVVGSAFPFQNGGLARQGNAALAMNLLGGHQRLAWLIPDVENADGQQTGSLAALVPTPARIAIIGVFVAVALFAFARARRLGPVVAERLPVVVRATETTEGRARLYRSLRARGRAAEALRRGAVNRLRAPLQLPRDAPPEAVVAAVAGRLGRDPTHVHHLLYGPAPTDDATLVRLADELDSLEREIRRP